MGGRLRQRCQPRQEISRGFSWLCYGSIHGPSKPAARHKGMYKDAKVPQPVDLLGPWPGKPDYLKNTLAWRKNEQGKVVAGGTTRIGRRRGRQQGHRVRRLGPASQRVRAGHRRRRRRTDRRLEGDRAAGKHAGGLHRRPGIRDGRARHADEDRPLRRQLSLTADCLQAGHSRGGESVQADAERPGLGRHFLRHGQSIAAGGTARPRSHALAPESGGGLATPMPVRTYGP